MRKLFHFIQMEIGLIYFTMHCVTLYGDLFELQTTEREIFATKKREKQHLLNVALLPLIDSGEQINTALFLSLIYASRF